MKNEYFGGKIKKGKEKIASRKFSTNAFFRGYIK